MIGYIGGNELKGTLNLWEILLQSLLAIIIPIPLAVFMHFKLINHLDLYHIILETICIFVALYIFFSIWFTYNKISSYYRILGFGYLLVAIFDALHTFYFSKLDPSSNLYNDLYTKFWILGRLTQAMVLFLYIHRIKLFHQKPGKRANRSKTGFTSIFFSKHLEILIVFIVAYCLSYLMTLTNNKIFILSTPRGVTPLKIILECIVILIFLISLFKPKKEMRCTPFNVLDYFRNTIFCRNSCSFTATRIYITTLLVTSILSELCFVASRSVFSLAFTIGHLLKIVSFIFLYRIIFVEIITYPYSRLKDGHRKLIETLKETNELAQSLNDTLDALPIAIIRYDRNGIMKHVNKKFEETLGYKKEDFYGLTENECQRIVQMTVDSERISRDFMCENVDNLQNVITTYRTKSGEYIKLRVCVHKITNGILKILYDVKKEQELENINLQTQTILNAVSSIILMIGKNNKIILCNKALEDLFEVSKEKLIGMDVTAFRKFIDNGFKELLDSAFEGHASNQLHEIPIIYSNDKIKNLLLYIAPIYNIDDEVIGAIIAGTDITELKEQQKTLVQQEKLAVLGQMGAGIVHETRNFLSTIKGRCQLIDMLTEDQSIKNHVSKINDNIDELNTIMSEFLFLSKPRQPQLEEVSMYDIIRSVKSMIEASSIVKGVVVDFNLSEEERYLMCDEAQIKQVILNICKNAVDAMVEQKCARLKIATGYNEQTNEMFVEISDNGKGIQEENLNKIGTPFFTTKQKGTGLGLSICYGIIKEHNGRIEVKSELGKGTTFTILLPCILDEDYDDKCFDEKEKYSYDNDKI